MQLHSLHATIIIIYSVHQTAQVSYIQKDIRNVSKYRFMHSRGMVDGQLTLIPQCTHYLLSTT